MALYKVVYKQTSVTTGYISVDDPELIKNWLEIGENPNELVFDNVKVDQTSGIEELVEVTLGENLV